MWQCKGCLWQTLSSPSQKVCKWRETDLWPSYTDSSPFCPLLLVSGLVGRDRICIVLKRDNPQCMPDTEYVLTNCLLLLWTIIYLSLVHPSSCGEREAKGSSPSPAAPAHSWPRAGKPGWQLSPQTGARVCDFLRSHFNPNIPLIALVKLPWLSLEVFIRWKINSHYLTSRGMEMSAEFPERQL